MRRSGKLGVIVRPQRKKDCHVVMGIVAVIITVFFIISYYQIVNDITLLGVLITYHLENLSSFIDLEAMKQALL